MMCRAVVVLVVAAAATVVSVVAFPVTSHNTSTSSGHFVIPQSCGKTRAGRSREFVKYLVVQSQMWLKTSQPAILYDDSGNACHLKADTTFLVSRTNTLQVTEEGDVKKQVCNFTRETRPQLRDGQVYVSCQLDRESAEKEMSSNPHMLTTPSSKPVHLVRPTSELPPPSTNTGVVSTLAPGQHSTSSETVRTVAIITDAKEFTEESLTEGTESSTSEAEIINEESRLTMEKIDATIQAMEATDAITQQATDAPEITSMETEVTHEPPTTATVPGLMTFTTPWSDPTVVDPRVDPTMVPTEVNPTVVPTEVDPTVVDLSVNPTQIDPRMIPTEVDPATVESIGVEQTGLVNKTQSSSMATETKQQSSQNSSSYNEHPIDSLPYFIGAAVGIAILVIFIVTVICVAQKHKPKDKHEFNNEDFFICKSRDGTPTGHGCNGSYHNAQIMMYSSCNPDEVAESFELEERVLKSHVPSPEADTPKCLRADRADSVSSESGNKKP